MLGELPQMRERFRRGLGCFMRMHPGSGVEERIPLGQPDTWFEVRRTIPGAYRHHPLHAGGAGALDHLLAVFIELPVVEVAMRIHQPHFRRAPVGMSSWNPAKTGLPSS